MQVQTYLRGGGYPLPVPSAAQGLGTTYVMYLQVYRKLEECYGQLVVPCAEQTNPKGHTWARMLWDWAKIDRALVGSSVATVAAEHGLSQQIQHNGGDAFCFGTC